MVKQRFSGCLLGALLGLGSLQCQTVNDLERRVEALEQKMRLLDPAFAPETGAPDPARRVEALESRLEALEKKIGEVLASRGQPPSPSAAKATPGFAEVAVSGDYQSSTEGERRLPIAGYMDFHVNRDSGQPFRPDFHRFVLLFGHSFSERIKFWSELELERSFVASGEVSGELALEQGFLDFLLKPWFNLRAGMVLAPVGIINERHEPPAFNGVERPFVETLIIPTTWRELGLGATGDAGRGFRYRAYLISGLDARRFTGETGIVEGRTAGFDASFRNPAKVARLEYAGVRGLTLGASAYSGHSGFNTPGINPGVTMGEFDGRFSFRRADFRALFANTWVTRAAELNRRLQQQTGINPNIARQMRGYYLEPAVHVLPRRYTHDVILFARYEKYNTQFRMPHTYVPLPQFDRSSWIAGVTYKPHADVTLKFDYVFNRNASSVVRPVNGINIGLGWWF